MRDGLSRKRAASVSLCERGVQLASAVLIEEPEQATGGAAEMPPVESDIGEKRLGGVACRK